MGHMGPHVLETRHLILLNLRFRRVSLGIDKLDEIILFLSFRGFYVRSQKASGRLQKKTDAESIQL